MGDIKTERDYVKLYHAFKPAMNKDSARNCLCVDSNTEYMIKTISYCI